MCEEEEEKKYIRCISKRTQETVPVTVCPVLQPPPPPPGKTDWHVPTLFLWRCTWTSFPRRPFTLCRLFPGTERAGAAGRWSSQPPALGGSGLSEPAQDGMRESGGALPLCGESAVPAGWRCECEERGGPCVQAVGPKGRGPGRPGCGGGERRGGDARARGWGSDLCWQLRPQVCIRARPRMCDTACVCRCDLRCVPICPEPVATTPPFTSSPAPGNH